MTIMVNIDFIIDRLHQNCLLIKACSVAIVALLFFHNTISGYSYIGNGAAMLALIALWLMNAKYLSTERYLINSHSEQMVKGRLHKVGLVPCAASWSVAWFHLPMLLMAIGISEIWI